MDTQSIPALEKAISDNKSIAEPSHVYETGSTSLRLKGGTLAVARVAWIIIAISTWLLFLIAIPRRYDQLYNSSAILRHAVKQLGLSFDFYIAYILGLEITLAFATGIVGTIIFLRKSDEVMALYASLLNIIFGAAIYPISETIHALTLSRPEFALPLRVLDSFAWIGALISLYIFPNGRFVPRWSRVTIVPFMVAIAVIWAFFPDSPLNMSNLPLLQGIILWAVLWTCGLSALIYRYVRISAPAERQQTKWIVFSTSIGFVLAFSAVVLRTLDPSLLPSAPPGDILRMTNLISVPNDAHAVFYALLSTSIIYLSLFLTPLAYAISITRYRLWDIDLLINRALVYVPLTGIVAGLYAASTAFLQKFFLAFTGQQSDAAIVLTTLIIASTFTPIKNSLQRIVDRRFMPAPDSMSKLKALDAQMRMVGDIIDPRRITQHVLDEAISAYQATGGAIRMVKNGRSSVAYSSDNWQAEDTKLSLELRSEGMHIGTLELGSRREGEAYSAQDRRTLQHIADELAHIIRLLERPEEMVEPGLLSLDDTA